MAKNYENWQLIRYIGSQVQSSQKSEFLSKILTQFKTEEFICFIVPRCKVVKTQHFGQNIEMICRFIMVKNLNFGPTILKQQKTVKIGTLYHFQG